MKTQGSRERQGIRRRIVRSTIIVVSTVYTNTKMKILKSLGHFETQEVLQIKIPNIAFKIPNERHANALASQPRFVSFFQRIKKVMNR